MAFSRRKFLLGLGGAAVGLPFFEGLAPKEARAAGPTVNPYALFYRRGNGVQQAIYSRNSYPSQGFWTQQDPTEQERWWPMQADGVTPIPFGALTTFGPISAMQDIEAYAKKTTVVKGLRHAYGTENGHPEGAIQGLTGAGVKYTLTGANVDVPDITACVPMGESLDNRIAYELSKGAIAKSMYMGFQTSGDATVSWLKSGTSLSGQTAQNNLNAIYQSVFSQYGLTQAARDMLHNQRLSVNDLVRADIKSLTSDPRMSKDDLNRLNLHLQSISDVETAIGACDLGTIGTDSQSYDSSSIKATVNIMARLSALAIACGARQSIVMNIGIPQDIIEYSEVSAVIGQYPFHAISHRQVADVNGSGVLAAGSDYHHAIDRFHVQQFKVILDQLSAYKFGDGTTLLDWGVNVHYSDLGAGQHTNSLLPYFYVGGAGGKLVTGQYINADKEYLVRFLNSIGAAVGVKSSDGVTPLDDFNSANGILPGGTVVLANNNYLSRNYTNTYYWQPAPGVYQAPADGKPPITGRLTSILTA